MIDIRCGPIASRILAAQLVAGDLSARVATAGDAPYPILVVADSVAFEPFADLFGNASRLSTTITRRLGEMDWEDFPSSGGHLLLIDLSSASDDLAGNVDVARSPRLTVFDAFHDEAGQAIHPDDVSLNLELVWNLPGGGAPSFVELGGEHLDEFGAHASIASNEHRLSLLLSIPMARLIESSIAVSDIACRLSMHPGVAQYLPDAPVARARTFQTRVAELAVTDRYGPGWLNIAAVGSASEARRVDGQIWNASAAAKAILAANETDRWSVAHFSSFAIEAK